MTTVQEKTEAGAFLLLGHASLDSTQVYAHVSITDLKEVHARCHPREKDRE
ncbi:MAG: hypothetical protein ACYC69_09190 [Thermodesulfovibrionales bacterium]